MKQYMEIKESYADCILFFRMGDFYELFDDDAVIASRILQITLTSRNNGAAGSTPLCGFPYHAAERYVPKMIQAGHKVAICEQVEDPKQAKGIVKREVVEVITAGTTLSENNLDAKSNSYLCSLWWDGVLDPNQQTRELALAVLDITTGEFSVMQGTQDDVENELYRLSPRELLFPGKVSGEKFVIPENLSLLSEMEKVLLSPIAETEWDLHDMDATLCRQFQLESCDSLGLEGRSSLILAAGMALRYVLEQKGSLDHLNRLQVDALGQWMNLDPPTLRNLELLKPLNSEDTQSTLFYVLDHTVTAMGGRRLKHWISHPLISADAILDRQRAVAELFESLVELGDLKEILQQVYDMERLIGRIGSGRANGRDLRALGQSLVQAEAVGEVLEQLQSPLFARCSESLMDLGDRGRYILNILLDELPLTIREGKLIRPGGNAELDELTEGIREAREWIAGLESRERERLDINSLKVGFNKVFGYYLEVSRQKLDKVPEDYIRKQTLANAERYITPEMKEYEAQILSAESKINELEYQIFQKLRNEVNGWSVDLRRAAADLSVVDATLSLALAARKHRLNAPDICEDDTLDIREGFHPVIKAANPDMEFITNDLEMNNVDHQIMLITGPNMAGKSTYLRQTGLIVLMAQMGSFVPAAQAKIGVTDRIFTRVGASDRLARGQSTFMVEMVETANILHHATPRSLILLDEIGRGTSTFDGLSLAWAIVETLHNNSKLSGKTLFATHYHELNALAESLERVHNYRITVKEQKGKLLFLRKIVEGACDSSYGIHVAEMAGVPTEVIYRAKRILHRLEESRIDPSDHAFVAEQPPQQDLFSARSEEEELLLKEIRDVDVDSMTPLQALNFLGEIKKHYIPS